MSTDDMVHRISVLEYRMGRVCKIRNSMYWSSYLEELITELDKSLKEVESKVDNLEAEITEADKKVLVVEVFSIGMEEDTEGKKDDMEDNMKDDGKDSMKGKVTQIKVKDKNIKEVSEWCLKGLSLVMKEFGNVSLKHCFEFCEKLEQIVFPPEFDTSSVTNMIAMFYECSSLNSLNLSTFNTSSVTNMDFMFFRCKSLRSLDLSTFNTSDVTSMWYMFQGCSNLNEITCIDNRINIITPRKVKARLN